MKKETIEEAADNWVRRPIIGTKRESFIEGYKLAQERSYSEEEVENILIEYVKTNPTKPYRVVSWFTQFKKK